MLTFCRRRPIKHPVYDCALCVSDGAKIRPDDILECDRHRQDTGEFHDTMGVIRYRKGYAWYYYSNQDEDDVLLFKNYDSATHVQARTCLHSAFDLPADVIPPSAPTRESIEVRALVFTYPEHGRRPSHGWSMPHPLAESLEQGHLKRVDDERSITYSRNDIDESHEIKDAMLILRRQEIRRLELIGNALRSERDDLKKQLHIQAAHTETLEAHVRDLEARLEQPQRQLWSRDEGSSAYPSSSAATDEQVSRLYRQLATAQMEAQTWKHEASSLGYATINQSYQAAVDEAVRREREKDAFVIDSLRREIQRLKGTST